MDVVHENFQEAAAQLEALLPTAAFVAIDAEMTGIILEGMNPSYADTPQQRYDKMVRVASEFTLMQVGLCLFHEVPGGGLLARPFNFYVMPSAKSSVRLVMHASTAHFHTENGMDFNKWFACKIMPAVALEYCHRWTARLLWTRK